MEKFDIHRKTRFDSLVQEYGLDGSRLLPWEGYPMPFAGGWCVVRPGTCSEAHTQIDQEIFIAIKGSARLVVGDREMDFSVGDIDLQRFTRRKLFRHSASQPHGLNRSDS